MGLRTALCTMNASLIAQMSCNPAVGGIAKGHLVREIDALGGIMGEVADAAGIQFRLLNTSRGPAVWSPRAQCDKTLYRRKMREALDATANLRIVEAEIADVIVVEEEGGRRCKGVQLGRRLGAAQRGGGGHDGHVPERADPLRGGEARGGTCGGASVEDAGRGTEAVGAAGDAVEDGDAAAAGRKDHRLVVLRHATGRSGSDAVQLPHAPHHAAAGAAASSLSPARRRTQSSRRTCIARRCIPDRSSPSDRGIALRSRTRS